MPFPSVPNPWSFYRLGPTKEKELFKRRRDTYDGIIIPAHIASYYSAFCSEFVGSLGKPYFIDPMTYIFANHPDFLKRFLKDRSTGRTIRNRFGQKEKGDIKRSYRKLVENEYGGIIMAAVKHNRPVRPIDFKDESSVHDLVDKIVAFQRHRLASIPEKYKKYEKYARKGGKKFSRAGNPPMCIVSPYFPTTTLGGRGWHSTNLDLIHRTKETAVNIPVFAVILAETAVLAKGTEQIAQEYREAGADGFLLWPDGFSGYQDSSSVGVVYEAVKTLSRLELPVILMYGDAFSLVLHYAGLTGFACGICYGERKLASQDVDVEGGIPPRYYLQRLKKKVQIETEARRIQIDQYPDLRCRCDICTRKPDPVDLDDTESREHFMLVRAIEIGELREGVTSNDFAAALDDPYTKYSPDPLLQPLGHLINWVNLLQEKMGE